MFEYHQPDARGHFGPVPGANGQPSPSERLSERPSSTKDSSPPSLPRLRSRVAWSTEPVPRKSRLLKIAWFRQW